MFKNSEGSGRGAGALVDLNLEGGENRVDIDLFGEPSGEHSSLDHPLAHEIADSAPTGESPRPKKGADLDFTLDAPERGSDHSPTRELPARDEPTVESEMALFGDSPTAESPALGATGILERISAKSGSGTDQTAELSMEDLGLDLDSLETTGSPSVSLSPLEQTDHPADAPTMVAGLDERSQRMMALASAQAQDGDMTELERELEASFIADLDTGQDEIKTAVLGPESAPTVQMPRDFDAGATSRLQSMTPETEATSKLRALSADSIDMDLDRLASALGNNDTVDQPRAAEEVFSTEVFEASQRSKGVDLDVGESLNGADHPTHENESPVQTVKLKTTKTPPPELEPVTMSEVGTKLDLARAYMDMGDPEGARSILDEVVHEGSASQKQEAQRLIETLPG
jgi:pilus assembly protein FimV